ncbi:MAG TPA: PIG-L deacetylase family protein [Candidatus Limnocylindrales bacterium]
MTRIPRRWKILIAAVAVLLVLPAGLVFGLNRYVNDTDVPLAGSLFPATGPKRLLAIFAHPDDEITMAGTLRRMADENGADITLAYLTRGEAASVPKKSPQELAQRRTAEMRTTGSILGAKRVELFDFPDSGLPQADAVAAKALIARLIDEYQPSVVVSFDEKVGFYGHADHKQVGIWVAEVLRANRGPVTAYYQATLPESMISVAKDLSPTFKTHYPADPALGLPEPTIAVSISAQGSVKRAALDAHVSQVTVLQAVQPGYDMLPSWIYFRILSREYFTRVF